MSVFHNINRYAIGFDHLMDHLVSLHSNNNLTLTNIHLMIL